MKVYKYGDNVDTDVIIPARYLNAPDEKSLASHCMEDIDASFASTVEPGDIIVAGANFGCGSSREHAPPGHQGQRRQVRDRPLFCPHFLPQRHQHRLPHPGVRRGGGGHPGRRYGERGLQYRRDHRRDHRQDLSAAPLPEFVQASWTTAAC